MGLAAATAAVAENTSSAADKAAREAQQAADKNLAFNNQVYGQAVSNLQPTVAQGQSAGNALSGLLNTGGNSAASNAAFQNYLGSTNYQFQLNQGENAVKTANAPAYYSGATSKALNDYAQGQAGNALSGYESLLTGQQGLGVQAASSEAGVGTNIAGQNAAANNSAAAAAGNAALTSANAWSNGLSQFIKAANQAATQSSFGA